MQLYTKEGTYRNFDKDISQWTLVANVGLGNPTCIPERAVDSILVRRNKRQSFYVTSDGPYLSAAKGKNLVLSLTHEAVVKNEMA